MKIKFYISKKITSTGAEVGLRGQYEAHLNEEKEVDKLATIPLLSYRNPSLMVTVEQSDKRLSD